MNRYADAEIFLNKYLALNNNANAPASAVSAYVHKVLGDIYSRFGDYALAIYHKKKSLAYYETTHDIENVSSETINLSPPFYETGLYDSAIIYLEKGLLLQGVTDKRTLAMYTELAANYIKKKEAAKAEKALQKGAVYFNKIERSGAGFEKLFAYNNAYADLLQLQKNYAPAILLLRKSLGFISIAYGNFKNRDAGKTYGKLGYLYQLIHDKDSSIYYYNKALFSVANIDTGDILSVPRKDEVYAENTIVESLQYKAAWMMAYANASNTTQYLQCAINCYNRIMDVQYKLLQYFSYDNSKLLMLRESRSYSQKAIDACYKLYSITKKEHWAAEAFRFAERSKSFILLESVKRNLAASTLLRSDSIYGQLQYAQLSYANTEKELIDAKNTLDTSLIHNATINLSKADEQLQWIKLKVSIGGVYKALFAKENEINAATVQKFLNNSNKALIEYFTGPDASYCFYITAKKTIHIYKLSDSLDFLTDSLLAFFTDKNTIVQHVQSYSKAAYALYNTLRLQETANTTSQLIIIPDGKLSYVPFDALLIKPSGSFNLSSLDYLVKYCQVTYHYSAAIMVNQSRYKYSGNSFIAFCPVFAQHQRGLTTLLFTQQELQGAKKAYVHGEYYEDSNATLTMFRKNASSAGTIHIASHASATDIPRIEFYDSTLYLNEIYAMQLHANLVVLSGCETGTGKTETGEGIISLARGFYYAGAHSVITSLWHVDDNSTAKLFTDFYGKLDRNNCGTTLRLSKLNYLSSPIANYKLSPYYWASFIYIGTDNDTLGFDPRTIFLLCITLIAVLIIAVLFLKKIFKPNNTAHKLI